MLPLDSLEYPPFTGIDISALELERYRNAEQSKFPSNLSQS